MTEKIRKNIVLSLLISLIRYLYPFISFVYISRILHPDGLGRIGYVLAFASIFIMIAEAGMPIYGMRTAAAHRQTDLPPVAAELFLLRVLFGCCSWLLFCLAVFVIQPDDMPLWIICGFSILGAIPECEWLYKGMEAYAPIARIHAGFRLLGILALLLFVRRPADARTYAWITVLMGWGIHLSEAIYADRKWDLKLCRHCLAVLSAGRIREAWKKHVPSLLLFFGMSCAVAVYSHTDTVMLGIMKGNEAVGIYSCAAKIKLALPLFTGALWAAALPKSAEMWRKKDQKAFQLLADRSFHAVQTILLPLVFFFFLFAGPCVRVLGGEEYAGAVLPMRLLLLAVIPIGFSNVAGGQLLIPMGYEKKLFRAEGIGAFSNILLNAVLIPSFSVSGAAVATAVSEALVAVLAIRDVRRTVPIRPTSGKTMKNMAIGCAAASLSLLIMLMPLPSAVCLLLALTLFGLLYCLAMVRFRDPLYLELLQSVKKTYRKICPARIRNGIRRIRRTVRRLWYRLPMLFPRKQAAYYCPCCNTRLKRFVSGRYADHPETYNPERYRKVDQAVLCPLCRSLPRHRILATWCAGHSQIIRGKILYFALEDGMAQWMKRNRIKVCSADLYRPADMKMDIEDTGQADETWDWIFCNHVLEHVRDAAKALQELYRILKPGGFLICSFPIDESCAAVLENPDAPESERIARFGQADHLRVFGRDSEEMLRSVGFTVSRIEGTSMPGEILPVTGPADYDVNYLFLCQKF